MPKIKNVFRSMFKNSNTKANKPSFPVTEQKIYYELKENHQPERAIINYILTQAANNDIIFATKNSSSYISFVNEEISNFLKDWFVIAAAHNNGKMSETMYKDLLNTMIEKYSFTEQDADTKEPEAEDN